MMWLEIIHLRVTDQDYERLRPMFTQLLDEIREKENCRVVKLFQRALLETDVCLHLYHDSQDAEDGAIGHGAPSVSRSVMLQRSEEATLGAGCRSEG